MGKLEKLCYFTENEIIFNKDFFQRVFIKPSIKDNKSLSGVSLRLAFILLKELSIYYPTEIPQRNSLANILGVSRTAVINALAQLEKEGFLIRQPSSAVLMVCADEEKQKEIDEHYEKQGIKEMKKRDFSGKFLINHNYNKEKQEESISEFVNNVSRQDMESVDKFIYINQLESRLREVENRLKKIENEIKKSNINNNLCIR
ncbi:HTH domain-containing protein [Clostridium tyrobutyricum]|uniref:HTH domain-containing protein n=1 Tax=Clostridium tyrobutyricum TaxID=1519 RepID=UPI00057FD3CA|nr:HTH domain-containing protein [Clostridium tyrobutyricum]